MNTLIVVAWFLHFSPAPGVWKVYQHERYFHDPRQALEFIQNAPKEKYECTESVFGQHGTCYVSDCAMAVNERSSK